MQSSIGSLWSTHHMENTSATYAVCAYRYIYMPKHTMPMQRQTERCPMLSWQHAERETCHMHNMAGQQAKVQEKRFTSATGM
jgi:hypothetical protein